MEISIHNPILPGFNPDPSILKVDETYYIAVSSFEWLPGIRVYSSTDLVNWQHLIDILTTQVNLAGNPPGGSIWAPQLSEKNGQFYCVFTDVKTATGPFKDCHNYVVTAKEMTGPWSAPSYLNSSGFDPSLFHDDDGKTWLLNEFWDYRRPERNKSAGIVLEEFDCQTLQLLGERSFIFAGTNKRKTEAPHLYRHNGYYYLVTAEGGTGQEHQVTICRSQTITGPYELSPHGPFLTASDQPHSPLQCCGHASFVKGFDNEWLVAYLATRPIKGAAILGRETCLQAFFWGDDGWPQLKNQTNRSEINTRIQAAEKAVTNIEHNFNDSLTTTKLAREWCGLRLLPESFVTPSKNGLVVTSGESLSSLFEPHVLAIRQKHHQYTASVVVDFKPVNFNQLAGLTLFLNNERHLLFFVTEHEEMGKVLRFAKRQGETFSLDARVVPLQNQPVELKVIDDGGQASFFYRQDTDEWKIFSTMQDTLFLAGGFTGNFIGLFVTDLNHKANCTSTFTTFNYQATSHGKLPHLLADYDELTAMMSPEK